MVSNASEDLPEPDNPVKTISLSLGISKSMFFKLCSLAPFINIFFLDKYFASLNTREYIALVINNNHNNNNNIHFLL